MKVTWYVTMIKENKRGTLLLRCFHDHFVHTPIALTMSPQMYPWIMSYENISVIHFMTFLILMNLNVLDSLLTEIYHKNNIGCEIKIKLQIYKSPIYLCLQIYLSLF